MNAEVAIVLILGVVTLAGVLLGGYLMTVWLSKVKFNLTLTDIKKSVNGFFESVDNFIKGLFAFIGGLFMLFLYLLLLSAPVVIGVYIALALFH